MEQEGWAAPAKRKRDSAQPQEKAQPGRSLLTDVSLTDLPSRAYQRGLPLLFQEGISPKNMSSQIRNAVLRKGIKFSHVADQSLSQRISNELRRIA